MDNNEFLEAAAKKCRNAGIAGIISGVLTAGMTWFALYSQNTDGTSNYFADPFIFLDVVIMLVLAVGAFMRSRMATVLLVIFFTLSQITIRIQTGNISGILVSFVFLYFFFNGALGAFQYTNWRREDDNSFKKRSIFINLLLLLGAGLFLAFLLFSFWVTLTGQV